MDTSILRELADTGTVNKSVGVQELRDAIPSHCFRPSYITSFGYLLRDILGVVGLSVIALYAIPQVTNPYAYAISWAAYGYAQGLFGTGLWVLAHECGHGAFSPSQKVNNAVGWALHSLLLTPYFSWKSTHSRHHIYANHMDKDHHYVPPRRDVYAEKLGINPDKLQELTADAPIVTAIRIVIQQVFGWPLYILVNLTAGPESTSPRKPGPWWKNSHFDPYSSLFRRTEFLSVVASDLGIGLTATTLWYLGGALGSQTIILLYVLPWLWVNHWIVAITYLHHTHPSLPKYERQSWSFLRGALATVDRDFGWTGRFFFHNIIDFHVIHHIFSRIPFYHAEEATNAIVPLLGPYYHQDRASSFLGGIWNAFTECQWVEPDKIKDEDDGTVWYHRGPSPAPEYKMRG